MTKKKINDNLVSPKNSRSIDNIIDAAKNNKLIVVVGAGVSKGLTNGKFPLWKELIGSGFTYAVSKGKMQESQAQSRKIHLESTDVDDLLSCAEFMGRKLGAPDDVLYERWLQEQFKNVRVENQKLADAFRTLSSQNIPICTLNYDHLLEVVTGLQPILISETSKTASWVRRESQGILHLHGSYEIPKSCILGISDYESTLRDEVRDLLQRNLAAFHQLLFIGCGDTLSDPNFSALVVWMRKNLKGASPLHYALTLESDEDARHQDSAWSGFVEPLSYGQNHDDLADFLLTHFSKLKPGKPSRKNPTVVDPQSVIENYRSYLIHDCGQMTIEGVSADMDTGQRKFDLEKLFVPLKIIACPPELPLNDPDRAEKLKKWHELNSKAKSFGRVLLDQKRIALLALPGGGKTLLLKRLAVAYADSKRRSVSADELPDLDLLPVLIRCREWRSHIKLPIMTLLTQIGDITGQANLSGLSKALVPFLTTGRVLLLVDGLDEIHNDAERKIFVANLEKFIELYKETRVVVTSREAGFGLVAPTISRICERWRLASLEEDAVKLLCRHWHSLMVGDSPAAIAEGEEVAQAILKRDSIRRIAENPLLLTMLLVVKHGAGGLPPDRVSLYGRAVEVLLDTWNIEGHEPLNVKEAVPQLAYVAFQLMKAGKQTVTEIELLGLLEEAREAHQSIWHYAKDTPLEFLKRVELRSSLLIEAGHQKESGRIVRIYQFRHLTFQEYLAAVAATEGHYKEFQQDDTVLTALEENLLVEEWKEVIPMAAVLAKKRSFPLFDKLIEKGAELRVIAESGNDSVFFDSHRSGAMLVAPVGLLAQCILEEAETSYTTIVKSLKLITFFARGCIGERLWTELCSGPYREELYSQAWAQYKKMDWPEYCWLMNTCSSLAVFQKPNNYWISRDGRREVLSLLKSKQVDNLVRGLLTCMGFIWTDIISNNRKFNISTLIPIKKIEVNLFNDDVVVWSPTIWVLINFKRDYGHVVEKIDATFDLLLSRFIDEKFSHAQSLIVHYFDVHFDLDRDSWSPQLSDEQVAYFKAMHIDDFKLAGKLVFFIGYHARNIWTDKELLVKLKELVVQHDDISKTSKDTYSVMVKALGGNTVKFWKELKGIVNIVDNSKPKFDIDQDI